jgi:acrylyl-CoA reductase (NADPH)
MARSYLALMIEREREAPQLKELSFDHLKDSDLKVKVLYSAINYKDALGLKSMGKVVKSYPFICGCDLAGVVVESNSKEFAPGDTVMASGFGIGENHWGGYGQYVGLKAEWAMKLPNYLSPLAAMAIGNAGLTAFSCIDAVSSYAEPPTEADPLIITGATGGVGSVALELASKLGFYTIAYTRKRQNEGFLKDLGAQRVLFEEDLLIKDEKRLSSARFKYAIDCVGGEILSSILLQMKYNSLVVACGHTAGIRFSSSIFPFILRAVTLKGIEMVYMSNYKRLELLDKYYKHLEHAIKNYTLIGLKEVPEYAEKILASSINGRVVVDLLKE